MYAEKVAIFSKRGAREFAQMVLHNILISYNTANVCVKNFATLLRPD